MQDLPLVERGRLLSGLASILATLSTEQTHSWRLAEALRRMLRADGVAITLEYLSDNRVTLCASDEVAVALESLQEVFGQGPGYEAARGDEVVVADLDGVADQRWPMLAESLTSTHGPLRVYAVPMHARRELGGVTTLHTRTQQPLAEPPERMTFLVNAVTAALMTDATEHPDEHLESSGAWSSRSQVHQATGMVMAQVGVTPEDALALLRGHAYALATDINDVSERVIGRIINFSDFDVEGD